MSENYQRLYTAKKESLSSAVKNRVVDVSNEMERARSSSPKPVERVPIERTNNKIAYKCELEELKILINASLESIKKNSDDVSSVKNSILELDSSIKKSNSENLKLVVNDAVKGFNENLKKVATEMIGHMDAINELKSRVESIESML